MSILPSYTYKCLRDFVHNDVSYERGGWFLPHTVSQAVTERLTRRKYVEPVPPPQCYLSLNWGTNATTQSIEHTVPQQIEVSEVDNLGAMLLEIADYNTGVLRWVGPPIWAWSTQFWVSGMTSDPARPNSGVPYDGNWYVSFTAVRSIDQEEASLGYALMGAAQVDRVEFVAVENLQGAMYPPNAFDEYPIVNQVDPWLLPNEEFYLAITGLGSGYNIDPGYGSLIINPIFSYDINVDYGPA